MNTTTMVAMKNIIPCGLLLSFAVCSCAKNQRVIRIRQELLAADTSFSEMSQARGAAEAFYSYLSTNALSLPAGEQPIRGRLAIRESLAGVTGVLRWHPQEADVAGSGDLGYTWGTFEYQSKDSDGQVKVGYGKYVTVWRKENRSWKAVLDCGNSNPAPR
jgi:ketosteroid isomerase-like protein